MTSNTPLGTIDGLRKVIEGMKQYTFEDNFNINVNWRTLNWLLNDAEELNKLNSYAIERNFEDAEGALKALADYEG